MSPNCFSSLVSGPPKACQSFSETFGRLLKYCRKCRQGLVRRLEAIFEMKKYEIGLSRKILFASCASPPPPSSRPMLEKLDYASIAPIFDMLFRPLTNPTHKIFSDPTISAIRKKNRKINWFYPLTWKNSEFEKLLSQNGEPREKIK